jgi:DNA polymerase V
LPAYFRFIKTSPFAIKEPYYGNVATEKLLTPTQDTRDIIAAATTALGVSGGWAPEHAKAGVMLNDFTGSGVSHATVRRTPAPPHCWLMRVLDKINNTGLGKVWFAGRGMAPEWQMKREVLSPA